MEGPVRELHDEYKWLESPFREPLEGGPVEPSVEPSLKRNQNVTPRRYGTTEFVRRERNL